MKVVINTCYGGFGLSHEGITHLAKLKGVTLYCREEAGFMSYYTVPLDQVPPRKSSREFYAMSVGDRMAHNEQVSAVSFEQRDVERNDPFLVQTVEDLGKKSWGEFAQLSVVEVPDGIEWEIAEYDGNETVEEAHRSWR